MHVICPLATHITEVFIEDIPHATFMAKQSDPEVLFKCCTIVTNLAISLVLTIFGDKPKKFFTRLFLAKRHAQAGHEAGTLQP